MRQLSILSQNQMKSLVKETESHGADPFVNDPLVASVRDEVKLEG